MFLKEFVRSMREEAAAIFVGAGLSRAAGCVDWKELLHDVAVDLGLDVNLENDLVALAQYHVNESGDRSRLNQLLVEEFTKDTTLTENHRLIARLPIRTIWTTNYDKLIEDAYREVHRKLDVKVSVENLNTTMPGRFATLHKMHGDVQAPHEAVLTKEDYESYQEKRQLFSEALKGDLVSKSFLFLGFSFEDPNVDYILSRIRVLLGVNKRRHYCIMKRLSAPTTPRGTDLADFEYRKRKMDLRIADLKRYSIQAILVDDYGETTQILRQLSLRVCLWDVFISGSAHDYGSFGKERMEQLCASLGEAIITDGFNLVSGFGLGIGGRVIAGAIHACMAKGVWMDDRLKLRPFPQGLPADEQQAIWNAIREDLVQSSGVAIFIAGNKLDSASNTVVPATGLQAEYELAKAKGKFILPLGSTGFLAKEIWEMVQARLPHFYPGMDVSEDFDIIGNSGKTNKEIVDATLRILRKLRDMI